VSGSSPAAPLLAFEERGGLHGGPDPTCCVGGGCDATCDGSAQLRATHACGNEPAPHQQHATALRLPPNPACPIPGAARPPTPLPSPDAPSPNAARTGAIGPREFRDRFFAIFGRCPGADDLFVQMALLVPSPPMRLALLQTAADVSTGGRERRRRRRGRGGRAVTAGPA
jgi:hypothetical protein